MIRNIATVSKLAAVASTLSLILSGCSTGSSQPANTAPPPAVITPITPQAAIKHVVVIFGENESFDHYFGTYPNAANPVGDPQFTAAAGTPTPNNYISNPSLLTQNPNLATNGAVSGNGSVASNPFRLARSQAWTASQNHNYGPEQSAFDAGKMDLFPKFVGTANSSTQNTATGTPSTSPATTTALTMGYYDGNTVTALWNYAQHYAMNDHSFGTVFGPSTNGAINVVSGQTNGVDASNSVNPGSAVVADGYGGLTDIGDADPTGDICSSTTQSIRMTGKNIGDLLNTAKLTWGWFEGGMDLTITNPNGTTGCNRSTVSAYTGTQTDYSPHHQPFQYYASTINPNHARPTSPTTVGTATDPANHQYDIHDFTDALAAGNLPAVSYLKAARYQDAHASNSDPLDEQAFIVNIVNAIEKSSFWSSTAIIVAYDDSDGWYDHLNSFINGSATSADSPQRNRRLHQLHRRWNRLARRSRHHPSRSGPLRLRPETAVPGHLALGQEELPRHDSHRPGLCRSLHRGHLPRRPASRRRFGGYLRRQHHEYVRLQQRCRSTEPECRSAKPHYRPRHQRQLG